MAQLHVVFAEQLKRKGGADAARPTGAARSARSAAAASFEGVLRLYYPQAKPAELAEMSGWVAAKRGIAKQAARKFSAEELDEIKKLFDGFDADGSGSVELAELLEAHPA